MCAHCVCVWLCVCVCIRGSWPILHSGVRVRTVALPPVSEHQRGGVVRNRQGQCMRWEGASTYFTLQASCVKGPCVAKSPAYNARNVKRTCAVYFEWCCVSLKHKKKCAVNLVATAECYFKVCAQSERRRAIRSCLVRCDVVQVPSTYIDISHDKKRVLFVHTHTVYENFIAKTKILYFSATETTREINPRVACYIFNEKRCA